MRSCYHAECDSGSNPNLRKAEGLKFLTKTAQAVVLAVAELSGGLEECDLSKIYGNEEPFDKDSFVDKDSTVELFVSTTEHTYTIEEEDDVEEANGVENEIQPQVDVEDVPDQVDNPKKPEKEPVRFIFLFNRRSRKIMVYYLLSPVKTGRKGLVQIYGTLIGTNYLFD